MSVIYQKEDLSLFSEAVVFEFAIDKSPRVAKNNSTKTGVNPAPKRTKIGPGQAPTSAQPSPKTMPPYKLLFSNFGLSPMTIVLP